MTLRKFASIAGFFVLLAVVAPFFVYAVPGAVGADHGFVVLSGSMEPEISPGDVVIVGETDPAEIEDGDVVTYTRTDEGTPVTHRVIDVREQGGGVAFETQGDANPEPDASLVPGENVIGSVVLTIPVIGYVIQFGSTTPGLVLLVGLPIGLLLLSEVWTLIRAVDTDSDSAGSAESGAERTVEATASTGDGSPSAVGSIAGESAAADGNDGAGVHVTDLTTTLGVLVVGAPYSVYVAFQLRTVISITAAFAACFSMLGLGCLWLVAQFAEHSGDSQPSSGAPASEAADGTGNGTEAGSTEQTFVWDHPDAEPPARDVGETSADGSSAKNVSLDVRTTPRDGATDPVTRFVENGAVAGPDDEPDDGSEVRG